MRFPLIGALAAACAIGHAFELERRVATTDDPVQKITAIVGAAENLAVQWNGQILVTTTSPAAQLFQVDPLGIIPPILLQIFPDEAGTSGITGLGHDTYYVAAGNHSSVAVNPLNYSYNIYEFNMRGFNAFPNGTIINPPAIRKSAFVKDALFLNGLTSIPGTDFILAADSWQGLVWRVDVRTGVTTIAAQDVTMQGVNGTFTQSIGINGIKIWHGYLYYTNTGRQQLFRLPILWNGTSYGSPELLASNITCDDLIIDNAGVAYVAGGDNVVRRVEPNGTVTIIAGTVNSNTSSLLGPTAVEFGRLFSDRTSLYVTTHGAFEGVSRIDLGDINQLVY